MSSAFNYHRAASVDQALALLEQHDDAALLAGGHSLIPALKLRLAAPATLVDIGHLEELNYIRQQGGGVAIGAATTHHDVATSSVVAGQAPLLAQAAAVIGDPQVRNMGTIGGSLAHADPAADYPAAVLASGAHIVVRGAGGERVIEADSFFLELFLTSLQPGEIITEVRIPAQPAGAGACYVKFPHPASRFAVVGCAAVVAGSGGVCTEARVAFTGVANAAFRDAGVEAALAGKPLDGAAIDAAAALAAHGVEVLSDSFAGADYRRHLATVFAGRALRSAARL
jgi:carbon-monoxide dehydrogenase medium subunit